MGMLSIYEHALVLLEENLALGPARVVLPAEGGGGAASPQLRVLYSGAIYSYRKETRLAPYPLPAGMPVFFRPILSAGPMPGHILRELPRTPGRLRRFVLSAKGQEYEGDEAMIDPAFPAPEDLLGQLKALRWDSPPSFFARREMLQRIRVWYEDNGGLPTLTGARVRSLAHQIYAVQRVLWARNPRFVLADEVGLGKTIEAGFVLQALLSVNPDLSVLVVAPGSMTRQWHCELYLRFGARPFQVVTDLEEGFEQQVIVSTTTLLDRPADWNHLTSRRWDMVIIDEAHQYPPGTPLFDLFRQLSLKCDGLLVLSATPSKRELQGILGLLTLVAPNQYSLDDLPRLRDLWAHRQEIWDRLGYHQRLREAPDFLETPASEFKAIADDWAPLLEGDETAARLLAQLREGERGAFDELEAYLQEHYRVDHRIIRTRRKTIQSLGQRWCARTLEVVEYHATPEEDLLIEHVEGRIPEIAAQDDARRALAAVYLHLLRLTPGRCLELLRSRQESLRGRTPDSLSQRWWTALLSDPSPSEEDELRERILAEVAPFLEEQRWLDHAVELARAWCRHGPLGARHLRALDWIKTYADAHPDQKLLVFTEDRQVAQAFAEALGRHIGRSVDAFHWVETQTEEEHLKRIALAFQRSPNRPVLVSDELGGEGRNFQMAEAVVHLDSPWAVARLEQRIGRLDRIGREADHPVLSVVLLGSGGVERHVHAVHANVFRVFERSIGGLEFLLPDLQRQIFENAVAGPEALTERRDALAKEVEDAFREAEQDFDQALDTSRLELERASEMVSILEAIDGLDRLEPIQYWARALGLGAKARENSDGTSEYRFKWTPSGLLPPLGGKWGETERSDLGTFDRNMALEREDLQFFAPGHRLVDALVGGLKLAHVGRLTLFRRDLGPLHRGQLFGLVLVHFDLDPTLWTDTPFDVGLLTRARRRIYPEVIERSFRLTPNGPDLATPVSDRALRKLLEAAYDGADSAQPVSPTHLADQNVDVLTRSLEHAMGLAVEEATAERTNYAREAMQELGQDLAPEMGFLRGQLLQPALRDEAQAALGQRELLLNNLERSRTTVAGVALILGR